MKVYQLARVQVGLVSFLELVELYRPPTLSQPSDGRSTFLSFNKNLVYFKLILN